MQKSHLYSLISKLTSNERRYVNIHLERFAKERENKGILLFQAVIDLTSDKNELLIPYLQKRGYKTDSLHTDKNYLFNSILVALNEYHKSKTISLILKDSIASIEILFFKGLYEECLRLIKQSEKQAREIDHMLLLLEILNWKKKCIGYAYGIEKAYVVNKEIAIHVGMLENLKDITALYYDSYLLKVKNEGKSKSEIIKGHRAIFNHKLLYKVENAKSFVSKIYWLLIYIDYYYLLKDRKSELEYLERLIKHLQLKEQYLIENPLDYVSIYSRLLDNPIFKSKAHFFKFLNTLRTFADNKQLGFSKEMISLRVFVVTSIAELEWHLIQQNNENLLEKLNNIEKQLDRFKLLIEPYYLINLYFLMGMCYFFESKFKESLNYCNLVLNQFKYDERPGTIMKVEILTIISQILLEEYNYAKSLINTFRRKRGNNIGVLEQNLITVLSGVLKVNYNKANTKRELRSLLNYNTSDNEEYFLNIVLAPLI